MVRAVRAAGARVRAAGRSAALRGADGDAAGGARRRRHGDGRPADRGAAAGAAPACTTARTTTARRAAIAAAYQAMDHPVADHAKAVMQVAAAGTGVRLSDGSTNVLPVGDTGPGARGVAAARPAGAPVPGARLLPGLGPAPGAAADPVRGHVRVLPRRRAGRGDPAAPRTWTGGPAASSTSRRPPGRSPVSCCAGWTAAPWTRRRRFPRDDLDPLDEASVCTVARASCRSGSALVDLVLRSRRVVTPQGERPAAVACAAGGSRRSPRTTPVPAGTRTSATSPCCPGLVDTHVHVNEPGRTEWEGFATATRAAAAGGVTTHRRHAAQLGCRRRSTVRRAGGQAGGGRAGQCQVDVGFWGGAVPGNAGRPAGAARRRGVRVQGVPGRLRGAGVPAAGSGRAAPWRWRRSTRCSSCTPRTRTQVRARRGRLAALRGLPAPPARPSAGARAPSPAR